MATVDLISAGLLCPHADASTGPQSRSTVAAMCWLDQTRWTSQAINVAGGHAFAAEQKLLLWRRGAALSQESRSIKARRSGAIATQSLGHLLGI
jgi:hypothetical protein